MKLINLSKLVILVMLLMFINYSISFETSTETEEKLKNKINISEGNMKHKKIHLRNHNKDKTVSSTSKKEDPVKEYIVKLNTPIGQASNLLMTAGATNSAPVQDVKLPEGPIFFSGWSKYFKYSNYDENTDTPKQFFKNNQYYEQLKLFPGANLNETSADASNNVVNTYIKSPTYFYTLLFKNNVNFVSCRNTQIQKTYDILNIDNIKQVQETAGYGESNSDNQNGIQDFGNFSEGFCFKVLTFRPRQETWIVCTESDLEKTNFMKYLKQLKLQQQRNNGQVVLTPQNQANTPTISQILSPPVEAKTTTSSNANSVGADGYWITLQDWTQCSLKCGGGTSTLQRMCVPPKNGGAPCEGPLIMTKPCNTQPCPNMMSSNGLDIMNSNGNNSTVVMKPVVKVMPFSSRPQRYTKCVIKESDLMLSKDNNNEAQSNNPLINSKTLPKMQIPVRVVMNNQTVSIFAGESYESQVMAFALADTFFKHSNNHQGCFILNESGKTAELCPFGFSTNTKILEEWDYDFNLFKFQCHTPKEKIAAEFDKSLNDKLQEKINDAKKQLLEERENEIKKGAEKEEANQMQSVIKNTNQVALQAIQKELNLEQMIKDEEAQREAREEQDMLIKIEEEKKKTECFMKAIKERELENQYNIRAKETQDEISSIKEAASQQVIIRRTQLKNQILQMRKKAERRKARLAKELLSVRNVMAETMGKASKKGDASRCLNALKTQNDRDTYCQASFADDYASFSNCKEADDFCTLCCDNEFGELNVQNRLNCYKTVCPAAAGDGAGNWVWRNKE